MAKRFLLASVLAAFVAAGTFAQSPLSAGGGFSMQGGKGGKLEAIKTKRGDNEIGSFELADFMFGGFLFVDAKYTELVIGVATGWAEWIGNKMKIDGLSGNFQGPVTSLDISLLEKYPIETLKDLTIFPLFGIGYNLVLSSKVYVDEQTVNFPVYGNATQHSTFRIMIGFGGDVDFGKKMYIRQELLGYISFPSRFFKDKRNKLREEKNVFLTDGTFLNPYGITFKLAVGYRF